MPKQITYNLNSTRATFQQKSLFLDDLLDMGCSLDVFVAHALNRLNWREVREIGERMISMKESQDQVYDSRTEMEIVDA